MGYLAEGNYITAGHVQYQITMILNMENVKTSIDL